MKTIYVVAAIILRDDRIFATQRKYGEFQNGWEFPGGKIEENETPEDALVREIKEELGVDIKIIQFFQNVEYDYPSFHLSMKCYTCKILKGVPHLFEHLSSKWLCKSELYSVKWLPADLLVVNRLSN